MERTGRIRTAGRICIAASLLWIIAIFMEYGYGLKAPGSGTLFSINQIMFSVAMAGWITGICGLRWARAAGDGWFGRSTLGLFAFGWLVLLAAGLLALVSGDADLPLFPIGGLTSMIGGLLAGIAVVGARRWGGWHRFSVLFYALYYLLVLMLPLLIADQEPSMMTEVLWGLAWLPIGMALVASEHVERRQLAFGNSQRPPAWDERTFRDAQGG